MARRSLPRRWVVAQRGVSGADPEAVFRGDPRRWLPTPARPRGVDRFGVTLRAGRLARTVSCRIGPVWTVGDTVWRTISWSPRPEPADVLPVEGALPRFRGELGLRAGAGEATLLLRGRYRPPAGILGATADAAALHRVARATVEKLLADVAQRLENAGVPEAPEAPTAD